MPTGSLCSERNVIGSAFAADLSLRREVRASGLGTRDTSGRRCVWARRPAGEVILLTPRPLSWLTLHCTALEDDCGAQHAATQADLRHGCPAPTLVVGVVRDLVHAPIGVARGSRHAKHRRGCRRRRWSECDATALACCCTAGPVCRLAHVERRRCCIIRTLRRRVQQWQRWSAAGRIEWCRRCSCQRQAPAERLDGARGVGGRHETTVVGQ